MTGLHKNDGVIIIVIREITISVIVQERDEQLGNNINQKHYKSMN